MEAWIHGQWLYLWKRGGRVKRSTVVVGYFLMLDWPRSLSGGDTVLRRRMTTHTGGGQCTLALEEGKKGSWCKL